VRRALVPIVLVLLAGPAQAGEKVAVIDTTTEGIEPDAGKRFEATLEEGLAAAGYQVVPRKQVIDALAKKDLPEGCTFGPCLIAIGDALNVSLVLAARITATGPSYTFLLTMVSAKTGAPVAQVADTCPVCTIDEALSQMTLSIVSLGTGPSTPLIVQPVQVRGDKKLRANMQTAAWWLSGLALAGLTAGGVLLALDEVPLGCSAFGAGAGLGIAGLTIFLTVD
jgi:hypothetical protein